MIKENAGKIALVALVIAIIAIFTPAGKSVVNGVSQLSGVTNFDSLELSQGLYVSNASTTLIGKFQNGSTGTALKNSVQGLCYIFPYSASLPASTTKAVECQANSAAGTAGAITALTGVQANDFVEATLSTTTAGTTFGGLGIRGVSASTTAGFITLDVYNGTGADFTWPITTNASGTAYYISSRP